MKPKILYYKIQNFQKSSLKYLDKYFEVFILDNPDHDEEKILNKINVLFAPMGFLYDKKKIDKCQNLAIIASPTTGEHHIDTVYAKEKNIKICSLKNHQDFLKTITPTAELTWGLIISITRKILQASQSVCRLEWRAKDFGERTPKMISNMTLGIVGLGRLGKLVANYGKAFNMKVFYYDPYVTDNNFIKCENLFDLARKSEIVSVHIHLTEKTKSLIDKKFIKAMPENSFIVNTARGGIVNEKDLLFALNSKHLAGAALDMIEGEHLPDFNVLHNPLVKYAREQNNLIITPKMGGATRDSWEKTEKFIIFMAIDELKQRGLI